MVEPVSTVAGVTAIITAATQVYNRGKEFAEGPAANIARKAGQLYDANTNSLTEHLKSTTLTARAYIDGNLGNEPYIPNILRASHNLWTALILSALQISQMTGSSRSLSEILRPISTEGFNANDLFTSEIFDEISAGVEGSDVSLPTQAEADKINKEINNKFKFKNGEFVADKSLEFPLGRIIEVTLAAPDENGVITKDAYTAKISLLVQILPRVIHPAIANHFVKLTASENIFRRWTQFKAGEISFWRDFVFAMDLAKKRREAIRSDKDGLMSEFLSGIASKFARKSKITADVLSTGSIGTPARNLANSVMIFSENTVKRVQAESGFNLHDPLDRRNYFSESFAMLVFVVDQDYNKVTLYMNGIMGGAEYDISAFNPKGSTNNVGDLLEIMKHLSTNGRPPARF